MWTWVSSCYTHQTHNTLNAFAIYQMTGLLQNGRDTTRASTGTFCIELINESMNNQFRLIKRHRLIVETGLRNSKQMALGGY